MSKHTVKSYDRELEQLNTGILDMGRLAETQLAAVLVALKQKDAQKAQQAVELDPQVNAIEHDLNQLTVHLLAARQPLAIDLRTIISSLKIATDLERIADYTKNIARQILSLSKAPGDQSVYRLIIEISEIAKVMLSRILQAYQDGNMEEAIDVRQKDLQIDARYMTLLSELRVCMMENAENISDCTAMLFIARCLERIGDHIKNIAEDIYFIVTGDLYEKDESAPESR